MNFYKHKKTLKVVLLAVAVVIGVLSLSYTDKLVNKMKEEERKNMEIWAQALSVLVSLDDLDEDITYYNNIISNNTTIPAILTDKNDSIIYVINFTKKQEANLNILYKRLAKMKENHERIEFDLGNGVKNYIYYEDSKILKQLAIYPFVQLGIISLFILVAYFAFSSSRKAEQNQVWVGMSKETAHQLGTPISSLMAWLEILELNNENKDYLVEMEKDVSRLQMIAERFSKIGSAPELPLTDLGKALDEAIAYMRSRISDKIDFSVNINTSGQVILPLNNSLFNWVIENVVKNSVDALEGKGKVSIYMFENEKEALIEIKDTGKGILKSQHKTVFNPGYTSKERGWGLGLSLAKRIIENYHKGKIFVHNSEINQGATFRIVLPKKI